MASDKALSNAELELTQKAQMQFPRGLINPEIIHAWNGCSKEMIKERMLKAFGEMPIINTLLKRISSFPIKPEQGKFIASERFVVDTSRKATVKISYLGDNFRESMLGLVEEQPPTETNICYYELLKASVDEPIIAELGGEQKAETKLAEIYALMKNQRNGEKGILLTNGYANIFYVRDIKVVLRAVSVGWDGGGWRLDASSVGRPGRWGAGYQVFSRNSL